MSPGVENGTPLQYSCPENPMDGGSWWATVHGVAKSHTRLSDFTFTFKDPCDYTELIWRRQWHPTPVLVWKIPWTEKPGTLQSMGSGRVGHNWVTSLSLFTFMHWRRKWQPTPVFLPGGLPSMGSHRVGHDWSDLAAAAAEPLTVWITKDCGKFLKRSEYQDTLSVFGETCIQNKKQQLEPDIEQRMD